MNSTFLMHCGGRPIGFDDPALSFVPQKTNTYEPVSFGELLLNTKFIEWYHAEINRGNKNCPINTLLR